MAPLDDQQKVDVIELVRQDTRAAEARADAAASKGKRRAGAKAASGTPRAGKRGRARHSVVCWL